MDILYKFSYIFNSLFLIATNSRFLRQKIIMPRRSVLTELEKSILLKIPTELSEMSKYYLLSEKDISVIKQKRGHHKFNRRLLTFP